MPLRPLLFLLVLTVVATPSYASPIRLEQILSAPAGYFSQHPDVTDTAVAPASTYGQELLAEVTSIPEPSALLLTGAGLGVLARRLLRGRREPAARPPHDTQWRI